MPVITLDKTHRIDTESSAVKSDGLRVWVGGESGSGKSNACMLLVAQYVKGGGQALVLDPHGEYGALWELRPGGKHRIACYGYGSNYIETASVQLVIHHLEQGHTVVLDLSHWALRPGERTAFVAELIAELYYLRQRQAGKTLVLVEESHLFIPQNQSEGDAVAIRTFVAAITGGRKFGLHFVLASQRQSLVDSNVVSQCNLRLFLRISEQKDWVRVVKQYLPPKAKVTWYKGDKKTDLNMFEPGDAVLVSRWYPVQRIHLLRPEVPVKLFNREE